MNPSKMYHQQRLIKSTDFVSFGILEHGSFDVRIFYITMTWNLDHLLCAIGRSTLITNVDRSIARDGQSKSDVTVTWCQKIYVRDFGLSSYNWWCLLMCLEQKILCVWIHPVILYMFYLMSIYVTSTLMVFYIFLQIIYMHAASVHRAKFSRSLGFNKFLLK